MTQPNSAQLIIAKATLDGPKPCAHLSAVAHAVGRMFPTKPRVKVRAGVKVEIKEGESK